MLWATLPVAAEQRMELERTELIGSRELPQVVHILSWQQTKPNLAPLSLEPDFSQALAPIDRQVFLRELRVYGRMSEPTPTDQTTP